MPKLSSIIEQSQKEQQQNVDNKLPSNDSKFIQRIDEKRIWKWIYQIIVELGQLHSEGKLHYNLSISNISVGDDDNITLEPGVADVASVKKISDVAPVAYMSPETITGDTFDSKSNMWALGCIFHTIITLAHPFCADEKHQDFDHTDTVNNAPSIILKKVHNYSWYLRMLPRWLLQKDPEFRPSALDVYFTVSIHWKGQPADKDEIWAKTTPTFWNLTDEDSVMVWSPEGHIKGDFDETYTAPNWDAVKDRFVKVLLPKINGVNALSSEPVPTPKVACDDSQNSVAIST
eukprot:CAMPEP_0179440420 /NCGR_PEP_ID=MMETSP0799-20121207/24015_1 /TAXON_ID=46947 /ORGANISM="Geminigera cryophila, Strain CCMP2564" /LENGTH=288 /DNA_ID=CAMNT_0021223743 /DNA_START=74 /DNA_END=940 /DNA_ORIENTATION=-